MWESFVVNQQRNELFWILIKNLLNFFHAIDEMNFKLKINFNEEKY
jgi:hypothetical protein